MRAHTCTHVRGKDEIWAEQKQTKHEAKEGTELRNQMKETEMCFTADFWKGQLGTDEL